MNAAAFQTSATREEGTPRDSRMPVIVVSGFLGSGKTTLLSRVLFTPELSNSMLIVNEIGEIGIDHHLLERSDEQTVLLDNGCMCCQVRTDLQSLLIDLLLRASRGEIPSFDRVIVETSGLADPGPIAQTLYGDGPLARDYRLAHIVTLVDTLHAKGRKASAVIATNQVAAADLIVLTKTDRATPKQLTDARHWAESTNPFARVQEASFGNLDVALLRTATAFSNWETRPASSSLFSPNQTDGYLGRLPRHAADVSSFTLIFDTPIPRACWDLFIGTLTQMRGGDLLRTKGILYFETGERPMLIQGVNHLFDRPVELARDATAPDTSVLVFIARNLAQDDVLALWKALRALFR